MGEILDPGTNAETCLMAGRGMNGLRGVIVCFNEINGRYTLELDGGEMMSLRKRNVRACKISSTEEEEEEDEAKEDDTVVTNANSTETAQPTNKDTDEQDMDTKKEAPKNKNKKKFAKNDQVIYTSVGRSMDARILEVRQDVDDEETTYYKIRLRNGVEKLTMSGSLSRLDDDDDAHPTEEAWSSSTVHQQQPSMLDKMLVNGYSTVKNWVSDLSPTTILLAIVLVYVWFQRSSGSSSGEQGSSSSSSSSDDSDYYYHPRRWWGWSYWHYPFFGWNYGLAGVGSVLFLAFLIRKYGTANGRRAFSMDRVWQRVMEMDFWELLRLAAVLEALSRI